MAAESENKQITTVMFDPEVLRDIRDTAKQDHRSVSNLVNMVMAQWLQEQEAAE